MRTHKSKRILPTSSSACSVLKRTLQPTAGPSRGCHGDSDEARRPHGTWRHGVGLTFDPEPHGAVRPIDAAWKELSSQSQKKPGHWRIRRQREERKQWGKRKDRTGNASWEKNSKVGKDSRIEREREMSWAHQIDFIQCTVLQWKVICVLSWNKSWTCSWRFRVIQTFRETLEVSVSSKPHPAHVPK